MNKIYFLALLAFIPIAGTMIAYTAIYYGTDITITDAAIADAAANVIFDDRTVSYLDTLSSIVWSYSSSAQYVTHHYNVVPKADGWYHSTITSVPKEGESYSVSFVFRANSDDTYTLLAPDVGVSATFAENPVTPDRRIGVLDPLLFRNIKISDSDDSNPYNLSASKIQDCIFWTSSWSAQSSPHDVVGEVLITWDGAKAFNDYCLFPYNYRNASITYEQQVNRGRHGMQNFDVGSPPYKVVGNWEYTRAVG